MTGQQIDLELLQAFERALDPRRPESGPVPARVLGYGEISCVLQIDAGDLRHLACKRMPLFESDSEALQYARLYNEYLHLLSHEIGIRIPDSDIVWFRDHRGSWVTAYILQEKLDPRSIANSLLHQLDDRAIGRLFTAVLHSIQRVFAFNVAHKREIEVGFDGQLSNWAVTNLTDGLKLPEEIDLVYFDTSTPLLRRGGEEQLNTELFLRSAPSSLRWIVRALLLEDVATRYYDLRKVAIDLLANLYKERRGDLVPNLLQLVNAELVGDPAQGTVRLQDVKSYYREDAFIWRLYLALRKIDRSLHEFRKLPYPYILPDKVRR